MKGRQAAPHRGSRSIGPSSIRDEGGREAPVPEDERLSGTVVLRAIIWGTEVWPTEMTKAPWVAGPGEMVNISSGNTVYVEDDDGPLHQVVRWVGRYFRVRARALAAAKDGREDSPFVDVSPVITTQPAKTKAKEE